MAPKGTPVIVKQQEAGINPQCKFYAGIYGQYNLEVILFHQDGSKKRNLKLYIYKPVYKWRRGRFYESYDAAIATHAGTLTKLTVKFVEATDETECTCINALQYNAHGMIRWHGHAESDIYYISTKIY